MKNSLFIIVLFIAFYSLSFSQPTIEWQKCYGGSNPDFAHSIQQTMDGGYIIAGSSTSKDGDVKINNGKNDFWIVKLNSIGNIQWQKSFGGSGDDIAYSIQQTNNGGYIVAGASWSNDIDVTGHHGSVNNSDYWIVKLDANGEIEWQKSLGGNGNDEANSIQQTSDGGYIIAGWSDSKDSDVKDNHGRMDYWIVKLDSTGSIEWQKTLGGSSIDCATSIKQTNDRGYIVAGRSMSIDGYITVNHGAYDYWIVKLDTVGAIIWEKSLGGNGADYANSIQQTSDNGYIIAGQSSSNDGDVTVHHGSYWMGIPDYWIVKINSIGNIQWEKSLGGTSYDLALSILQTGDTEYIVSGYSNSDDGDVTENHGYYDFWIVKLNLTGIIQWKKSYGGSDPDEANLIEQTNDGGFIVAGSTNSNDGDVTGHHGDSSHSDIWIVKLSPDITDVKDNTNHINNELSISPNPASDNISISFANGINKSIHIYNSLGIEIKRFDEKDLFGKNSIDINVEEFPSGMYYVSQDIGCLPDIQCLTRSFVVIR